MKKDKQKIKDIKREMEESVFPIQFRAAVKKITHSLKTMEEELECNYDRTVIQSIASRRKTPASIYKKLLKKGLEPCFDSACCSMQDLIGVRAVCIFQDDVYAVADMLKTKSGLSLRKEKDYIQHPKKNGYTGIHLVFEVPVYVKGRDYVVFVEVQLRSMAMNYWSIAEHQFLQKKGMTQTADVSKKLKQYAEDISKIDQKMQQLWAELEQKQSVKQRNTYSLVIASNQ